MKRIAVVVACVGAVVASASCGKGTLGTPGAGGQTGGFTAGRAGAGGFVGEGAGGDVAPPPLDGGAGFGDVGAAGASGGFGGTGGSGFVICPNAPTPACGPSACGNGSIDTCQVGIGPGCMMVPQSEACDGDQYGGDTCARRRYGSGKLTCSSVCTVDDTTCDECLPIGSVLVACGPAPIAFPSLQTFAVAATDTEVGIAQVDVNVNTGATRLTFARLDRTLGMLGAAGLEDTAQPGPLQGAFIDTVAVTTMPSGWLVAACAGTTIFVDVVDASGKKVARTVIDDGSDGTFPCQTGMLALAARPTGGALMTWGTYYSWAAVLIGADGLSAGKPQPLVEAPSSLAGAPAAAWINDAYTVAVPLQILSAGYPLLVHLLRVAADGTISKVADILKGEFSFGPSLAAGADDTRLIYDGVAPGGGGDGAVMLRRLGSGGELLSSPSTLGLYPMYGGRAPAVAFGNDTVVLLTGYEHDLLTVARVDAVGNVVGRQDVASAPLYDPLTYDIVRRGPDAVVAWMKPGGSLMLARVLP